MVAAAAEVSSLSAGSGARALAETLKKARICFFSTSRRTTSTSHARALEEMLSDGRAARVVSHDRYF